VTRAQRGAHSDTASTPCFPIPVSTARPRHHFSAGKTSRVSTRNRFGPPSADNLIADCADNKSSPPMIAARGARLRRAPRTAWCRNRALLRISRHGFISCHPSKERMRHDAPPAGPGWRIHRRSKPSAPSRVIRGPYYAFPALAASVARSIFPCAFLGQSTIATNRFGR